MALIRISRTFAGFRALSSTVSTFSVFNVFAVQPVGIDRVPATATAPRSDT